MSLIKKYLFALIVSVAPVANALEFTVHHAPGGPSDRVTRLITKYLPGEYTVVNRPGAGGRSAVKHLIKNNTLMLATTTQIFVTNTLSELDSGYDADRDLAIIGTAAAMPNVLACKSSLAIKTIKDLNGKSFNFGVAGYGSSEHIATEILFTKLGGTHLSVPYAQGGAQSVTDLLAGNLDCMFANYPTIKPFMDDRRLTLLLTSHDLGLNLPTWRETYAESFPFASYLSIVVSKYMEQNLRQRIETDIALVFNNAEFKSELRSLGLFVVASTDKTHISQVERANTSLVKFLTTSKIKLQ